MTETVMHSRTSTLPESDGDPLERLSYPICSVALIDIVMLFILIVAAQLPAKKAKKG